MRRSFKYRAYLNKTTEANAERWLRACQKLYNRALAQRIARHQLIGEIRAQWGQTSLKEISSYRQQYDLVSKRVNSEHKDIDAQCLERVLVRLDEAFKHFFRRVREGTEKPGFPKFKAWDRYDSFTLRQSGWRLEDNNLYIRNVGRFKLRLHRPIEGRPKTVTIKREVRKWYVSFSCEDVPGKPLPATGKVIGIDAGLDSFITDSDANKVPNPRFYREAERQLRRKQRKLSRCKRRSKRRRKVRAEVARLHHQIANRRKAFVYNVAAGYVRDYDLIAIEDLNVRGMVQNPYLAKSIHDASWRLLFTHLQHKGEETGRKVVLVDPKNTSQECSGCGTLVMKGLNVRTHSCKKCGLVLDRDVNAAKNILGRAVPSGAKSGVWPDLSEKHAS